MVSAVQFRLAIRDLHDRHAGILQISQPQLYGDQKLWLIKNKCVTLCSKVFGCLGSYD